MHTLLSFAALFLSIALLQLSSGTLSPLDALSGIQNGFSTTEIGMVGSAHFFGFFIGCWISPRLIGNVGHSRAFAAFAASGAISAIAHPLWIDPYFWIVLRIMTGLCVAGSYTVVEAWLQAQVENQNRGRVLGVYRSVDLGASLVAQLMIAFLEPGHYMSYNLLAIICCASLLPLAITRTTQPVTPHAPQLHLIRTLKTSPLGVAGVMTAGVTAASFRMIGPVYGQQVGLSVNELALFLSMFVFGGALAQIPAGWLADRYDRRWVLIVISIISIFSCMLVLQFGTVSKSAMLMTTFFFGVATYPVFSLASAHANDFAPPDQIVELSASLMFFYGVGAIVSPLLASILIDRSGTSMLFVLIGSAHLLLAIFGLYRMIPGRQATTRRSYRYLPRTTFIQGRLLKRAAKLDEE